VAETVTLHGIRCIVLDCGTCGVPFTMPELVYNTQVEEGGFHTCPNGHSRGWDDSRSQREAKRREQERLKQAVAQKDDEIAELKARVSTLVVTVATTKRETTRLKKHAAAGVCPCCHRTVRQMAAHMKSKHPDYVAAPLKLVAS
jgi:hypothetical protein